MSVEYGNVWIENGWRFALVSRGRIWATLVIADPHLRVVRRYEDSKLIPNDIDIRPLAYIGDRPYPVTKVRQFLRRKLKEYDSTRAIRKLVREV